MYYQSTVTLLVTPLYYYYYYLHIHLIGTIPFKMLKKKRTKTCDKHIPILSFYDKLELIKDSSRISKNFCLIADHLNIGFWVLR
jgi:hypothetical protein